ncbi:MAG: hypothetical protein KAR23_00395, partial [Candidatus Aenigmarchaeota archaeon]|nr:hypothetical protein [Candidatus Aenigmarchaeota archaeon]
VCKTDEATSGGCTGETYCTNVTNVTDNPSCDFTSERDDVLHTWYAFIMDHNGTAASANSISGSYTTDSTPPDPVSITNVAGDSTTPYWDSSDDSSTIVQADDLEADAQCRYSTTDEWFNETSDQQNCTGAGTISCDFGNLAQQSMTNYYISCVDQYGNEQNFTTNLDFSFGVDWSNPTSSWSDYSSIYVPGSCATWNEADVHDPDPMSWECHVDNSCTPETPINDTDTICFNDRGLNYLNGFSMDHANNSQDISRVTMTINTLPNCTYVKIQDPQEVLHITDHTPDITWTYYDYDSQAQDQYRVEIRTAPNNGGSVMGTSDNTSSSSTTWTYSGSALVDGTTYYARVWVNDGLEWSPANETEFRMNSIPEIGAFTINDSTPKTNDT